MNDRSRHDKCIPERIKARKVLSEDYLKWNKRGSKKGGTRRNDGKLYGDVYQHGRLAFGQWLCGRASNSGERDPEFESRRRPEFFRELDSRVIWK